MSEAEAALDRADMDRLVAGHEAALNDLMARHAGRLHAYLFRLLQDAGDADDLAQEAFVRVYEHRGRYDPRHTFSTWLYTIATNLVRDRYRWRSRHPELSLEAEDVPGAPANLMGHLRDPRRDPGVEALLEERKAAVQRAIAALPEDLRTPLVLAEYEDLGHQEIAVILGCSAKAVEMRIYRARKQLRDALAAWLQD